MDDMMPVRKLPFELVEITIVNLIRMAVTTLPRDVVEELEVALERETSEGART
jgi:tartrate dehydratase alpha subunit/fumarate hydratase class I-like protein